MQSAPAPAAPQGGNWTSGIFDIMADDKVCLQTCCCGFCTLSNYVNFIDNGVAKLDPIICCGICCADYFLRGAVSATIAYGARRQHVVKNNIAGEDMCRTCVLASCCGPCSFCQVQRDMMSMNQSIGGICVGDPPAQQTMGQAISNATTPLVGAAFGAIGNKVASMMPTTGSLPPRYNSPLFGCELMECLDGWCCFCCMLGFISNKVDAGRIPEIPVGGENKIYWPACLGAYCNGPGMGMGLRRELKYRYGLEGESFIMSMLYSVFCGACSLCQMRREMGYRGEWPGGIIYNTAPPVPQQK